MRSASPSELARGARTQHAPRPPSSVARAGFSTYLAYGLAIGAIGGLVLFHRPAEAPAAASRNEPARERLQPPALTPTVLPMVAAIAPPEPEAVELDAPAAAAEPQTESSEVAPPAANEPQPRPFDRTAASNAVQAAAAGAADCGRGQGGSTRVAVTFAPSGRATVALVEPGSPFSGTEVGSCIATRMRAVSVPPFDGARVTVHTTLSVR